MSFPTDWLHHHRQADCLTILPMSFILETQSRPCSKLTSNFHHHIVCLERQLWILRWHLIYGYNNILLHHPLAWCHRRAIASSWSLSTRFVVIIINILTPSKILIEFMMRSTLLALDDFYYHRQHPWLPFIANLSTLWIQLALQLVLCSALKCYCLFCRECCGNFSTS